MILGSFKKNYFYSLRPLARSAILSLLLLAGSSPVFGQVGGSSFELSADQQFPEPNQTVTLTISSSSLDLNRSTISWYLDDVKQTTGIGVREFKFTTGAAGSVSRVKVLVNAPDKSVFSRTAVFRPAAVDILWQANSYTPPFYKGRASIPSGGLITFTALSTFVTGQGAMINPADLIYTWIWGGITLGKASGYGKQSVTLSAEASPRQPMTIAVEVSTFDKTLRAKKNLHPSIADPVIAFYEKSPLQGIRLESAFGKTVKFEGEEMTIFAAPYFFSLEDVASDKLRYSWSLNGVPFSQQENIPPQILTLRREGVSAGQSKILLSVDNQNLFKALQSAKQEFLITFGL